VVPIENTPSSNLIFFYLRFKELESASAVPPVKSSGTMSSGGGNAHLTPSHPVPTLHGKTPTQPDQPPRDRAHFLAQETF